MKVKNQTVIYCLQLSDTRRYAKTKRLVEKLNWYIYIYIYVCVCGHALPTKTEEKIFQKVLGGTFFETRCRVYFRIGVG